ncbi:hypothetical protein C0993_001840 [Termitomyces sp. T159_Od127]|nr:hypothetical protein C0993_001840 [Termitomyces sp. T159_Od127]
MGKWMEEEILLPIAQKESETKGRVEVMGTSGAGNPTEWYEIYLGTDLAAAQECKSKFLEILEQYGQDQDKDGQYVSTYGGIDADAYIKKVKGVLKTCISKGSSVGFKPVFHGEGDPEHQTPKKNFPLSPDTKQLREERVLRKSSIIKDRLDSKEKEKLAKANARFQQGLSEAAAGMEGLNLKNTAVDAVQDDNPFLAPAPAGRTTQKLVK